MMQFILPQKILYNPYIPTKIQQVRSMKELQF